MTYKLPKKVRPIQEGAFTLVELLVVIGILTILLSIALIAINPLRQFQQSNNTRRRSDILAILNAITEYSADNSGALSGTLSSATTAQTMTSDSGASNIDICDDLIPTYIAAMPYDPETGDYTSCSNYDTQYTVVVTTAPSRVTVAAPDAGLSETISIIR